jgi:hypothetical protein
MFVQLRHTDVRVPHARLVVTDVHTGNGTAFLASLSLDDRVAANIENNGYGGPTRLRPGPAFTATDMDDYVHACRLGGQTLTREQVLGALVDEYRVNSQLAAARRAGGTLVRLRDAHGDTLIDITVTPAPHGRAGKRDLVAQLDNEHPQPHGTQWQIWERQGWVHLTPVTLSGAP